MLPPALALIIIAAAVVPQQEARLEAGIAEINAIDDELASITKHEAELTRSRAARVDEITSLRARYPDMKLAETATPAQIYTALHSVRIRLAKELLPITLAKKREADENLCRARQGLIEKRAELEGSEDYKKLSLDQRLALRHDLDAVIDAPSGVICDSSAVERPDRGD